MVLEGVEGIQREGFFEGFCGLFENRGTQTHVGGKAAPPTTRSVVRYSVLLVVVGLNPVGALRGAHLCPPIWYFALHHVINRSPCDRSPLPTIGAGEREGNGKLGYADSPSGMDACLYPRNFEDTQTMYIKIIDLEILGFGRLVF